MDRRVFLKLIGTAAITTTTPLMAFASKLRWISFTEKMPKIGRNVVSLCYFNNNASRNISIGKVFSVEQVNSFVSRANYPEGMVWIKLSIDYSEYYTCSNGIISCKEKRLKIWDIDCCGSKEKAEQQIKNFSWKREFSGKELATVYDHYICWCLSPRHGLKEAPYVGRDATYWMYYDGLMEKLPPLPESKPLKLEYRNDELGRLRPILIKV